MLGSLIAALRLGDAVVLPLILSLSPKAHRTPKPRRSVKCYIDVCHLGPGRLQRALVPEPIALNVPCMFITRSSDQHPPSPSKPRDLARSHYAAWWTSIGQQPSLSAISGPLAVIFAATSSCHDVFSSRNQFAYGASSKGTVSTAESTRERQIPSIQFRSANDLCAGDGFSVLTRTVFSVCRRHYDDPPTPVTTWMFEMCCMAQIA